MGALLGLELVLELARRKSANPPCRFFASGMNPPHARRRLPPIFELPDDQFIEQFKSKYNAGLKAEVLADPELRALYVPILRADCTLVESHLWKEDLAADIPFSIFGGTEDPWTSAPALAEWSSYTRGSCHLRMFQGDHFFHQSARLPVVSAVLEDLALAR